MPSCQIAGLIPTPLIPSENPSWEQGSSEPKDHTPLTKLLTQQHIYLQMLTESFSDRVLRSPSVKLFLHVDDAISPFYDVMHILNDVSEILAWCVLIRKGRKLALPVAEYSFLLGSSFLRRATACTVGRRAGVVNMSTKANTRGGTPRAARGARAVAAKTSERKYTAKTAPVSHCGSNSLRETRSEACGGPQKKTGLSGAAVWLSNVL